MIDSSSVSSGSRTHRPMAQACSNSGPLWDNAPNPGELGTLVTSDRELRILISILIEIEGNASVNHITEQTGRNRESEKAMLSSPVSRTPEEVGSEQSPNPLTRA